MEEGHSARSEQYYRQYEKPGLQATALIQAAGRKMNSNFVCPTKQIQEAPLSKLDCFIANSRCASGCEKDDSKSLLELSDCRYSYQSSDEDGSVHTVKIKGGKFDIPDLE